MALLSKLSAASDALDLPPFILTLLLSATIAICVFCLCCCRCRNGDNEPLLPKHAARSDFAVHEGRVCRASSVAASEALIREMPATAVQQKAASPTNVHEGRVCRASALAAACSVGQAAFAAKEDTPVVPKGNDYSAIPPWQQENGGAAPKQQKRERCVCVSDDVEIAEGQRGGGWGDLDGTADDVARTVGRWEYPTSRRGADRDEQRAKYLAERLNRGGGMGAQHNDVDAMLVLAGGAPPRRARGAQPPVTPTGHARGGGMARGSSRRR